MTQEPVQVERYERLVWENSTLDAIRREECLCLHCVDLKPGSENCPTARILYEICASAGLAIAVSRCPHWKPKQ